MKSKPNVLGSEIDAFDRRRLSSDSYLVLLEETHKKQIFPITF